MYLKLKKKTATTTLKRHIFAWFHTLGNWNLHVVWLFAGRKWRVGGTYIEFLLEIEDRNSKKISGWHWNCASASCTNNLRTEGVTYFTLPSDPELQKGYAKVVMNENVNWRKHVISRVHWTERKVTNKPITRRNLYSGGGVFVEKKKTTTSTTTIELIRKLECKRRVLINLYL